MKSFLALAALIFVLGLPYKIHALTNPKPEGVVLDGGGASGIMNPKPSSGGGYDISDIDDAGDAMELEVNDPFENNNRKTHMVNKAVDKLILRPIASTYREVIPNWIKDRVSGVLTNMREPVNFINAVLQLNADSASRSIGRFLTNTIIGVGGLFDIASQAREDMYPEHTDFGLTLKSHGVPMGPYIVLPVLGPSSLRDAPGIVVDFFIDPFNSYLFRPDFKYARTGIVAVTRRESLLDITDHLEETSVDEYSTIRAAYIQKR